MRSYLISNYGFGNYQYFAFLKTVILYNTIIGCIGLLPQVLHWNDYPMSLNSIVITSYFVSEKLYLLISAILQTFIIIIAGINARYDRHQVYPELARKQTLIDNIPRKHLTDQFKKFKRFISSIVFGCIVSAVFAVSFIIGTINKNFISAGVDVFNNPEIVLLAAFVALVQLQSRSICFLLTSFEEHKTWSSFRRQYFIKLLVLKSLSTLASYVGLTFVSLTGSNSIQCSLPNYAWILVVFSYTIKYLSLFLNFALNKYEIGVQPEFDLADEYADTIHKSFIAFSCFFGFPTIGLLVAAVAIFHYFLLIVCLKYIFKPPVRPTQSLMPIVDTCFAYTCWLSLISSRLAFCPAVVEVFLNNECLNN